MALDLTDHEVALMDTIRRRHGALIAEQCKASSVRSDFLAALVANESSGDEKATRFEPAVYGKLLEVCAGKRAEYKPAGIKAALRAVDLFGYIEKDVPNGNIWRNCLSRVVDLATSHGLTQIMGWHCVEFARDFSTLEAPAGQLKFTLDLLAYFAEVYNLDLATDDGDLFRCWNTGRPDGTTYDPQYMAKGVRRAGYYKTLSIEAGSAT